MSLRKVAWLILPVLTLASAVSGQNSNIQTLAGGGVPQKMQAGSASLGYVSGVAVDSGGNVYMSLQTYSAVVKMDVAGALTLVAGNGTPGFSGDNGPAVNAQLNGPWGIAVDNAGNLYIADSGNNRIRKVSNGRITTVAGGSTPSLSYPIGVTVDTAGNIYIADTNNNVVRKVSGAVMTTVAGTGVQGGSGVSSGAATSVPLNSPTGVAVDVSGNLFIADYGNNVIRQVTNGALTSPLTATGPVGLAVDAAGDLFIASWGSALVGELQTNGTAVLVAGNQTAGYTGDGGAATSAEVNSPAAVAVDASGNVYIADYGNYVVRKVSGGVINTVAGSLQGFVGDNGPATSALLFNPTYTATGPAGEIYIVDSNHNSVRKLMNGVITTVAGTGAPGYTGDNGLATSAQLNAPWAVAVDATGNLYISDYGNGVIRKVSGGVITTVAGNGTANYSGDGGAATSATLNGPSGIAVDAAGNLYIADYYNNRVRKVAGGVITTVAGNGTGAYAGDGGVATAAALYGPLDVKVDSAGNLYIADQSNNRIRIVAGGVINTLAGDGTAAYGGDNGPAAGAQFDGPSGIALDAAGNVLIADTNNNVIRKIAGGVITTIAGNGAAAYGGDLGPATSASLNGPSGVSADSSGAIYIADSGNNLIRAMNLACHFTLTSSSLQASAAGGSFNIGVQTASFCSWSVSGLPAWITIAGAASNTGPGTVALTVAADAAAARAATITIAGISVSVNQAACTYAINPGGQAFTSAGGSGTVSITTASVCAWSVTNSIPWIALSGTLGGTGNGSFSFLVAAAAGGRSGAFTVAGLPFTVEQQAAPIPGLSLIGSMPHIAAEENWTTTFTLVNTTAAANQVRPSLFGDSGSALTLPLTFPQQAPASGSLAAASVDRILAPNASLVISTAGQGILPVQVGSAQVAATGSLDGFAIFHQIPTAQEAVVPLETRNAGSYLLAFDNTNGVVLGVAIENVSAQAASIPVVILDDTGSRIGVGTVSVPGSGHTSFVLSSQFPVTANKRGTIEFDTPTGGRISALGIRFTPFTPAPPALPFNTLTTIPALANVGTGGGSFAHLAVANGWKTTFVLVNAGASAAQAHLNFYDPAGSPLSLAVSFPQAGGSASPATSVDRSLNPGAMLMIESTGALTDPLLTGSAQLTTDGNVSGFVIFRYLPNGQEAVVPMESRNAGAYLVAFDNTGGTATGVAINSVSAQAVDVPVVVRDDTGAQIATATLHLASNGHSAFTLAVDKFPETAGIRGTLEFDTPAGGAISALGIRIPPAHTFTTLPALVR